MKLREALKNSDSFKWWHKVTLLVLINLLIFGWVNFRLYQLGEFGSLQVLVSRQQNGEDIIILRALANQGYPVKSEGLAQVNPELIVLGSSRVGLFTADMFKGHTFYNCGYSAYTIRNYTEFLENLPSRSNLKHIVANIDFFMFDPQWTWGSLSSLKDAADTENFSNRYDLYSKLAETLLKIPNILFLHNYDAKSQTRYMGLYAIKTKSGVQRDGSMRYSQEDLDSYSLNYPSLVNTYLVRVQQGSNPLFFAHKISESAWMDLKEFVDLAKKKGIQVTFFVPPIESKVIDALSASSSHGIWKEFESAKTAARIRAMGVEFLNYSRRLNSENRSRALMLDPFHANSLGTEILAKSLAEDSKFF